MVNFKKLTCCSLLLSQKIVKVYILCVHIKYIYFYKYIYVCKYILHVGIHIYNEYMNIIRSSEPHVFVF